MLSPVPSEIADWRCGPTGDACQQIRDDSGDNADVSLIGGIVTERLRKGVQALPQQRYTPPARLWTAMLARDFSTPRHVAQTQNRLPILIHEGNEPRFTTRWAREWNPSVHLCSCSPVDFT